MLFLLETTLSLAVMITQQLKFHFLLKCNCCCLGIIKASSSTYYDATDHQNI